MAHVMNSLKLYVFVASVAFDVPSQELHYRLIIKHQFYSLPSYWSNRSVFPVESAAIFDVKSRREPQFMIHSLPGHLYLGSGQVHMNDPSP